MRFGLPRTLALAALVLATMAVASAGCGSGDSDEPSEPDTTAEENAAGDQVADGGTTGDGAKPLAPPKAEESIAEAQERIAETIASGDCDRIVELSALSRPVTDKEARKARCSLYEGRLQDATAKAAASYADGGGVIAYRGPGADANALLVLDADGLYHIAFLDSFLPEAKLKGEPAPEFGDVAEEAVDALRDRDCDAFLAVAHRRLGPGALERQQACEYVDDNPIAVLFENYPEASLESFGGSPDYAFYGISGVAAHHTLVFARESDEGLPSTAEPLPEAAPEYALAGIFRTNLREPADGDRPTSD